MSSWPKPDPEREEAHKLKDKVLWDEMKAIEERLKEDYAYLKDAEYQAAFKAWRSHYDSCRQCGSHEVRLENYSMMWHDGDIVCNDCGRYVRMYDAG